MEICYLCIEKIDYPLLSLGGHEALAEMYEFSCCIKSSMIANNDYLLSKPAQLKIKFDNSSRTIAGIITKIKTDAKKTTLYLCPQLARLNNFISLQSFIYQNIPSVINELLKQKALYHPHQINWQLENTHPIKDYYLQAPRQTDANFLQNLLAHSGIYYWLSTQQQQEIIHLTDNNLMLPKRKTILTLDSSGGFAKQKNVLWNAQFITGKKIKLIGISATPDLFPGQLVSINAENFAETLSGDYQITAISHQANYPDTEFNHGSVVAYQQKITLTPSKQGFQSKSTPCITAPHFTAITESDSDYPLLDEQGQYRLRYHFDLSNKANTQATPYLPRLLPYAGSASKDDTDDNKVGWHLGLNHHSELFMGYFDGDISQPIILGSLPNPHYNSPVTNNNPSQYRFKSATEDELCLDDNPNSQHISLQTQNKHNQLYMSNAEKSIQLLTQEGKLNLYAKQNIQQTTKKNLITNTQKNLQQQIKLKHETQTQESIYQESASNSSFNSNQSLQLNASKNIAINSKNNLKLAANKKMVFNSTSGHINIQSQQGKLQISSNNKKLIINSQQTIHISTGGAGVALPPSGNIIVYGNSVSDFKPAGNFKKHKTALPFPPAIATNSAAIATDIPDIKQTQQQQATQHWISWKYIDENNRAITNTAYEIQFADGSIKKGMLDRQGKARHDNISAGSTRIKLGNHSLKQQYEQQLRQERERLKFYLNKMVNEVRQQAFYLNQELQKQGLIKKGLIYTGAFLTGLYQSVKSGIEGLVDTVTASAEYDAECFKELDQGDWPALKAKAKQIAEKFAIAESIVLRFYLLLSDEESRQLLLAFPKQYFAAESSVIKTEMLGAIAFNILLLIFTDGAGDAAEAADVSADSVTDAAAILNSPYAKQAGRLMNKMADDLTELRKIREVTADTDNNHEFRIHSDEKEKEPAEEKTKTPKFKAFNLNPKKFTEYALNPKHPKGKHKARVFESKLGFNASNYQELLNQVKNKIKTNKLELGTIDDFGQRYIADMRITGPKGSAIVRTVWINKTGSTDLDLVTLYIK